VEIILRLQKTKKLTKFKIKIPKLFFLKSTDCFDDIKAIDIIERETNETNFF